VLVQEMRRRIIQNIMITSIFFVGKGINLVCWLRCLFKAGFLYDHGAKYVILKL